MSNFSGTHGYGYGGIDGLGYDDLGVSSADAAARAAALRVGAASQAAGKLAAAATRRLKTGVYGPDGPYHYQYNSVTKTIRLSNRGAPWVVVSKGSSAYKAILSKMLALPKLSTAAVKAVGAGSGGVAAAVSAALAPVLPSFAPGVAPASPYTKAAAPLTEAPSGLPRWVLPVAVGGGLLVVALIAFAPRGR